MSEFQSDRLQTGLAADRDKRLDTRQTDLAGLADQLNSIAATLRGNASIGVHLLERGDSLVDEDLRRNLRNSRKPFEQPGDIGDRRALYAEYARDAYATRRRRSAIFDNDELFGEPAWDILLDLYIAHVDNKAVSVSSACIGSAAPPTTGLRWLGVLAENDLVRREHDPDDQRRVLVRLTERGLKAMDEYFASAGLTA